MKRMSGVVVLSSVALLLTGCGRAEKKPAAEPQAVASAPLAPSLAESALDGDWSAVQQALGDDVDVNAQDEGQRTLLMFAAFNGNTDMVKMLIKIGAEVNHRDAINRTALMFASTGPYLETVRVLLENGAEVNAIDSHENWTALMMAAAEGQTDVVHLLLANGADVNMKDVDGEDSAYFARQRGFEALAQMLEKAAQSE